MSVLDRSTLVDSPLADLHAIASELSIDGYRRLRRPELIEAILDKQDPDRATTAESEPDGAEEPSTRRRRGRRGGRGRSAAGDEPVADTASTEADTETPEDEQSPKPRRSRSRAKAQPTADAADAADTQDAATEADQPAAGDSEEPAEQEPRPARGRRGRAKADTAADAPTRGDGGGDDEVVAGTVELLANGSGFVRVAGPEPSDDDVYISSAQVKRCELVAGDTVTGPKRAPRRSERFASLIRVETINGRPASERADGVRFDDLPAALPSERITVGSEDPTLKAIEWLTPFGRGSRVTITGSARAGKTEALRRLAAVLADADDLTVSVALAGVRPEETSEWTAGPIAPAAAVTFAASEDAQLAALETVVDQARRLAARGEHAVVLIDGLDGLSPVAARRLMASARAIVDGGSVTLIATASAPIGGETTVIALDAWLTSIGRFPALDLIASGTLRPELLVGEEGAAEIARTRAEVSGEDED